MSPVGGFLKGSCLGCGGCIYVGGCVAVMSQEHKHSSAVMFVQ